MTKFTIGGIEVPGGSEAVGKAAKKLNGHGDFVANEQHPADDSKKPYYDKVRRAIIHDDIHLTPQNKKRLVEKEYHSYHVPSLEADIEKIDKNIAMFHMHIREEEARRTEIKKLIKSGRERDQRLLELLG